MTVEESRFRYAGLDSTALAGFRWRAPAPARAVLQIAHGAGEHSGRYRDRLLPLAHAGVVIYAADHRGHGLTSGMSHLGDLGPGGAQACITDMAELSKLAREENPGLPLILMGHSMGGMFAQAYLFDHSPQIDGLVLSGTRGPGPRLEGGFNSVYPNPRTPYDWLSRDEAEVDRYVGDPLCGIRFDASSTDSLRRLSETTEALAGLGAVRPGLPVLVFAGQEDPVHNRLRGLQPLVDAYRDAGLAVDCKIYPGGRHEMLNETNREEVVADLLAWVLSVKPRPVRIDERPSQAVKVSVNAPPSGA